LECIEGQSEPVRAIWSENRRTKDHYYVNNGVILQLLTQLQLQYA